MSLSTAPAVVRHWRGQPPAEAIGDNLDDPDCTSTDPFCGFSSAFSAVAQKGFRMEHRSLHLSRMLLATKAPRKLPGGKVMGRCMSRFTRLLSDRRTAAGAVSFSFLIVALCLAFAPATFAASPEFESESETYPVKYEAKGSQTFEFESEDAEKLTVSCSKVTASGEISGPVESITLDPSYSGCTAKAPEGEDSATVNPGTCGFEEKLVEETVSETFDSETSIKPSGCGPIKIEVPAIKCTIEMSSQGPFTGAVFDDVSEGAEVAATESGATISSSSCEIGCPHMKIKKDPGWKEKFETIKLVIETITGRLSAEPDELKFKAVGEVQSFKIENRIGADIKAKMSTGLAGPNKAAFEEVKKECRNKLYKPGTVCTQEIKELKAGFEVPFEINQGNLKTVTATMKS